MIVAPGSTSISVDVFFADDSGAAVTGKVAADFPVCKWSGGGNTADTTITLSDLAAITTAHPNDNTAGGVKEREGGWYRLDLPNDMFTAAGRKTLTFAETTNKRIIAPPLDVQYVQSDNRQWLGGTIPAVSQTGVPLVDLKYTLGTLSTGTAGYVGVDWAHVTAPSSTVNLSGTTISTGQAITSVSGAVGSVTGNVGGNVAGSVASVTAGVTVTTNNDKTGYALTSGERDSIAAALLDLANGVETSLTLRQALKLIAAISAGQVSGGGTSTVIIKAANNAGTTRITATCDSSGNRSSLTLNV